MSEVGKASVEIVGDVRDFARQVKKDLERALASIEPLPLKMAVDADHLDRDVTQAGRQAGTDLGAEMSQSAGEQLRRDDRISNEAGKAGGRAGDSAGKNFASRFSAGVSKAGNFGRDLAKKVGPGLKKGFEGLTSLLSPVFGVVAKGVAVTFGAAFVSTAAGIVGPALAAAITTALGAGLGVGLVGLGALALREAKPLREAFKGLRDTLDEVARKAAQPLLQPLVKSLQGTRELLRQLRPEWTSIFKQLAPAVEPLTRRIGEFAGALTRGIRDSMPGITSVLKGFGDGLVVVGEALADFFREIFSNEDVLNNAAEGVMRFIAGPLKLLGSAISGLTVLFAAWRNMLLLVQQEDVFSRIGEAIANFVDGGTGALGRIRDAWGPVADAIQNVWDKIKAFAAEDDAGKLSARFQEVVAAIKAAWEPIKEFLGVVWEEALAFLRRVWDEQFVPWWEGTARPWIAEALKSAFEMAWNAAKSTAASKVGEMINDTMARLRALPGRIGSALAGIPGAFSSMFTRAAATAAAGATRVANGIMERLRSIAGRVRSALNSVRNAVTGAFSGAGGWLRNAGTQIINGLISGLQAGFNRVRGVLNNLTGMLPDWKGPEAVDRKILHRSGQLVMEGFQRGILDSQRSIANTLAGVTGNLSSFAAPTGQRGYGAVTTMSGGITFNINVAGAGGQQVGRQAAEQVLRELAAAGLVR